MDNFEKEVIERIDSYSDNRELLNAGHQFMKESITAKYSYNFSWMGRPIIQYPQDMVAIQEIIWDVKPDLIIEAGIAHGGSLILNASILALLDLSEAIDSGKMIDPKKSKRKVVGIDIDIRAHNRAEIEAHPMFGYIEMIEGSSTAPMIINSVKEISENYETIMIFLDSNHTHDHVLAELNAYASLTSVGSYCVVFDTMIEDFSDDLYPDRPWNKRNNPKTAVHEFLKTNPEFGIDKTIPNKLITTVCPDGFLKKMK